LDWKFPTVWKNARKPQGGFFWLTLHCISGWVGLCMVKHPTEHIIGHFRDGFSVRVFLPFYRSKDPTAARVFPAAGISAVPELSTVSEVRWFWWTQKLLKLYERSGVLACVYTDYSRFWWTQKLLKLYERSGVLACVYTDYSRARLIQIIGQLTSTKRC